MRVVSITSAAEANHLLSFTASNALVPPEHLVEHLAGNVVA